MSRSRRKRKSGDRGKRPAPASSSRARPPLRGAILLVLLLSVGAVWYSLPHAPRPQGKRARSENRTKVDQGNLPTDDGSTAEATSIPVTQGKSWQEMDDPSADGWSTEVFHQRVKNQLKKLGQLLTHPDRIEVSTLEALVAHDFSCDSLVPADLTPVFEGQGIQVERARIASSKSLSQQRESLPSADIQGAGRMAEALRQAGAIWASATDARFEFKVYQVLPSPDYVTTVQHLSVSGQTQPHVIEQHATWHMRWTKVDDGSPPRLLWIGMEDFEQTRTSAAGYLYSDCTESVLGHNDCYTKQLLRGVDHWLARIEYSDNAMSGIAVGDVDGDGLDDVYLCQGPGLPNRLFLQKPDGTASDVSEQWGVDWLEDARSALLVDLDNDGDQDLVVSTLANLVVASNEQNRRFRVRTVLPTSEAAMSLAAADYDRDGRLDLFVAAYSPNKQLDETQTGVTAAENQVVYHDANNGAANSLFRNETTEPDSCHFVDVTGQVGLDANNRRWSFAASWEDFDNDGDQDLYVANDVGTNNMYRNDLLNGNHAFVDVAANSDTKDAAFGMSVTWGDYDRDGHLDIYVSNMFSAAGKRIMHQPQFKSKTPVEVRRKLQHLARGNTLLRNLGDGRFVDVSDSANVRLGRWGWSSNFVDVNNDGWEDLVVANGYLTRHETGDL